MAVRFVADTADSSPPREDRENLAEVIELRTRLSLITAAEIPAVTPQNTSAVARSAAEAEGRARIQRETVRKTRDACHSEAEVRELSVRLLARKALSVQELREQLLQHTDQAAHVEAAISECLAALYLDDAALALRLTEKLSTEKGCAKLQISRKLRARKLEQQAIDAALATLSSDDEYAYALRTAEQRAAKLGGLDRAVAERRLFGFLARRGVNGEHARRAVREALNTSHSAVRFTR